jgi:DNA-binding MarR family transcriptional regulator
VHHGTPERLHELLLELVRAAVLLQPDQAMPGQPVSLSQAMALHELDVSARSGRRGSGRAKPRGAAMPAEAKRSTAVADEGQAHPAPLSQRELALRLGLEKSTVSRLAAELERKGLLVRERDPDNRRLYRLRLTDRGRAMHVRIAEAFHAHFLRWEAAMTHAERTALDVGLPALVRAIRSGPVPWRPHPVPGPAELPGGRVGSR